MHTLLLRAALRGGRVMARPTARAAPPCARRMLHCSLPRPCRHAAAAVLPWQPPRGGSPELRLSARPGGQSCHRSLCSAAKDGRGSASEADREAVASLEDEGEEGGGDGDDDGFYLDVDVMIVESTEETPQLLHMAADIEATAPLLLQAVLDLPPHVVPPPALAAVRRAATGAELSVALCGDDYITALNAEWRGLEEATDVLSFPQVEAPDGGEEGVDDESLFAEGHALLGDVIISVDTAARQAAARGATLEEEVQVLLVHGLLHLLGYDHDDVPEAEAAAMASEETRVLQRMGWGGIGLVTSAHTGTSPAPQPQAPVTATVDKASQSSKPRRRPQVDVLLCDLDGTLLSSAGLVTPNTRDALRAAQAAGIAVYIATGKARPGAMAALAASGLSLMGDAEAASSVLAPPICHISTPGVFLNGVLVYARKGALAFQRQLPFDAVEDALNLAAEAGVAAAAFTGDHCFALAPSPLLDALHTRYYEPLAEVLAGMHALRAGPPPVKILLYASRPELIDQLRPRAEALLAGRAHIVQAVPDMLEVLPLGASKGIGAKRLLDALGVAPGRTAAIGDGENDLDMLRGVGLGLAMANAVPSTRAAAAHVLSRSNDEDGVAEAIERYLL